MKNVCLLIVIYERFVFFMSEEFVHTAICYQIQIGLHRKASRIIF